MAKDENEAGTSATGEQNEWGIPDWRDANNYGAASKWDLFRWRWEFYRRRDDLRTEFDAAAQRSAQIWKRYRASESCTWEHNQWVFHCDDLGYQPTSFEPEDPGFVAFVSAEVSARFGYHRLPNPRISDQPPSTILPNEDDSTVKVLSGDVASLGDILESIGDLDEIRKLLLVLGNFWDRKLMSLNKDEIAVGFNLNKPLGPQLKVATTNLKKLQSELHGKSVQRRRHPKKWLHYLRTLDARETHASWSEISEIHPNSAQTEQTARDIWKAADALRFNF